MDNAPSAAAHDRGGLERSAEALERDILPRLLAAHQAGPLPAEVLARLGEQLADERVAELLACLRGGDDEATDAFVQELLDDGVTSEAVYMDLLAPAARALGVMWEDDTCDFVQVTLSLGRMQRIVRSLSHLFLADVRPGQAPAGRIYLTCLPGEQHTLGLVMVAEFFVRAGWQVELGHPVTETDLADALRESWFDVVGFSLACDSSMPALKRDVRAVRRASRNPAVRVIVGGRPIDADPGLVRRVGADGTAADARLAPAAAAALLQ